MCHGFLPGGVGGGISFHWKRSLMNRFASPVAWKCAAVIADRPSRNRSPVSAVFMADAAAGFAATLCL
jgi:hypothetical protein